MEALAGWHDFCVATAGATAALAGLTVVALSVNIGQILATPTIPARAGSALAALVAGVVAACAALAPGQPLWALGAEIGLVAVPGVALQVVAVRRIVGSGVAPVLGATQVLVGAVAPVAYLVGAMLLLLGLEAGFGVVAVAIVASLAAGVFVSWVALVEVLR
ncbi:UNVERIFIED_CONTAM: hypothetical protein LK11_19140 [Mumia flava]|uniref:hypothetical protein n=1 Tax=Mumia flava TaxID=1348852 RepID=UPI000575CB29|nr:hypothetical protein [Mumia flava]